MGKRKRVPEDLMGIILSETFEAADEKQTLSESRGSPGAVISWDESSERVGITFNLSKQLGAELESLRQELQMEGAVRPSRSEIAEAALWIAVEDVRVKNTESELFRKLSERRVDHTADATGGTTPRRSVDESGWIFETIHDENGEIIDEDVIGTIADLPIMEEYVDEQGRLVSLTRDELGNTFEQIMDEQLNVLGTRRLSGAE